MSWRAFTRRLVAHLRNESGAAMVEFALVAGLFFFVFFALIDFGRLMYTTVHMEKAGILATRIAVTRPAACLGVPTVNVRPEDPGANPPTFGASCDFNADTCKVVSVQCGSLYATALDLSNPTVQEIWGRIEPLLPPATPITALNLRYDFDPDLGYLGGPYTPMVTVEFDLGNFQFVAPLAGLAALVAGEAVAGDGGPWTVPYPEFSVSLPAEDLRMGPGS